MRLAVLAGAFGATLAAPLSAPSRALQHSFLIPMSPDYESAVITMPDIKASFIAATEVNSYSVVISVVSQSTS